MRQVVGGGGAGTYRCVEGGGWVAIRSRPSESARRSTGPDNGESVRASGVVGGEDGVRYIILANGRGFCPLVLRGKALFRRTGVRQVVCEMSDPVRTKQQLIAACSAGGSFVLADDADIDVDKRLVVKADTTISGPASASIGCASVQVHSGVSLTVTGIRVHESWIEAKGSGTSVALKDVTIVNARDHKRDSSAQSALVVEDGASATVDGGSIEDSGKSAVVVGAGSTVSLTGVVVKDSKECDIVSYGMATLRNCRVSYAHGMGTRPLHMHYCEKLDGRIDRDEPELPTTACATERELRAALLPAPEPFAQQSSWMTSGYEDMRMTSAAGPVRISLGDADIQLSDELLITSDAEITGGTLRGRDVVVKDGASAKLRDVCIVGGSIWVEGQKGGRDVGYYSSAAHVTLQQVSISSSPGYGAIIVRAGGRAVVEGGSIVDSKEDGVHVRDENSTISLASLTVERSGRNGISAVDGGKVTARECTVAGSEGTDYTEFETGSIKQLAAFPVVHVGETVAMLISGSSMSKSGQNSDGEAWKLGTVISLIRHGPGLAMISFHYSNSMNGNVAEYAMNEFSEVRKVTAEDTFALGETVATQMYESGGDYETRWDYDRVTSVEPLTINDSGTDRPLAKFYAVRKLTPAEIAEFGLVKQQKQEVAQRCQLGQTVARRSRPGSSWKFGSLSSLDPLKVTSELGGGRYGETSGANYGEVRTLTADEDSSRREAEKQAERELIADCAEAGSLAGGLALKSTKAARLQKEAEIAAVRLQKEADIAAMIAARALGEWDFARAEFGGSLAALDTAAEAVCTAPAELDLALDRAGKIVIISRTEGKAAVGKGPLGRNCTDLALAAQSKGAIGMIAINDGNFGGPAFASDGSKDVRITVVCVEAPFELADAPALLVAVAAVAQRNKDFMDSLVLGMSVSRLGLRRAWGSGERAWHADDNVVTSIQPLTVGDPFGGVSCGIDEIRLLTAADEAGRTEKDRLAERELIAEYKTIAAQKQEVLETCQLGQTVAKRDRGKHWQDRGDWEFGSITFLSPLMVTGELGPSRRWSYATGVTYDNDYEGAEYDEIRVVTAEERELRKSVAFDAQTLDFVESELVAHCVALGRYEPLGADGSDPSSRVIDRGLFSRLSGQRAELEDYAQMRIAMAQNSEQIRQNSEDLDSERAEHSGESSSCEEDEEDEEGSEEGEDEEEVSEEDQEDDDWSAVTTRITAGREAEEDEQFERVRSDEVAHAPVDAASSRDETRFTRLSFDERLHCAYMCHTQDTGGAQTHVVAGEFRERYGMCTKGEPPGPWLDKWMPSCDAMAMEKGISECKVFFIMMTKGIMSKPYPIMEMRWAKMYNLPVVGVMDKNSAGGEDFIYGELQAAPADLKDLCKDVEYIPYRTKGYEQGPMMDEVMRRAKLTPLQRVTSGSAAVPTAVTEWLEENELYLETLADEEKDDLAELFTELGVSVKLKMQLKKAIKDIK